MVEELAIPGSGHSAAVPITAADGETGLLRPRAPRPQQDTGSQGLSMATYLKPDSAGKEDLSVVREAALLLRPSLGFSGGRMSHCDN